MGRWLRGFALATAAALCGGCGQSDGRPVVRFIVQPDAGGGYRAVVEKFALARPDILVEMVEGPASTDSREEMYIGAFMAGDSPYDVVLMDVIWVPKFAAQGWLLPLDDRFPSQARDAFLPGDVRAGIWDGRCYRVPLRSDAGMLYYRSDLVPDPPATFEALAARARGLKTADRGGFVFQGRQYEGLVCAFLEVLWGHGGDVLDDSGAVVLDSPEGIRALTWLAGLVGDGAPEGVTTYQEEEARAAFQEGRAVFMRNWPYAWAKLQEDGSPVKGKVGIVPMVHAEGRESAATLGGWGFGISRTAKFPDAAWAFIEFATAPEQQKLLNARNGAIPTRRALFEDPEILARHPHYPELFRVLLAARPRPVHPQYSRISQSLQRHLSAALVKSETPEEAIRKAAGEIRGIVGK
ncbi:MAG: ABC transporter substrate-binding protein [Candidatus Brocadiae bacterium]|nr:ABC transporter substrate-binding protein [Candidatus Brocadiia bacterium]